MAILAVFNGQGIIAWKSGNRGSSWSVSYQGTCSLGGWPLDFPALAGDGASYALVAWSDTAGKLCWNRYNNLVSSWSGARTFGASGILLAAGYSSQSLAVLAYTRFDTLDAIESLRSTDGGITFAGPPVRVDATAPVPSALAMRSPPRPIAPGSSG